MLNAKKSQTTETPIAHAMPNVQLSDQTENETNLNLILVHSTRRMRIYRPEYLPQYLIHGQLIYCCLSWLGAFIGVDPSHCLAA